jgi:hypothetical protein
MPSATHCPIHDLPPRRRLKEPENFLDENGAMVLPPSLHRSTEDPVHLRHHLGVSLDIVGDRLAEDFGIPELDSIECSDQEDGGVETGLLLQPGGDQHPTLAIRGDFDGSGGHFAENAGEFRLLTTESEELGHSPIPNLFWKKSEVGPLPLEKNETAAVRLPTILCRQADPSLLVQLEFVLTEEPRH